MNLNNKANDINKTAGDNNRNSNGDKIQDYFNSLKSINPEIIGKEKIIDHLIKIKDGSPHGLSLRAAAALFTISLLFTAFSAYIACGAINASELEPAAAVYIGVAPAVETMSLVLDTGGEAAVILISLSFFCFISASVIVLLASFFLYIFNRPAIFNFHGYKPDIL